MMNTRFAPSPTGDMHIGSIRAAIMPYLYARKYGCKFILRIDDTDTERSKEYYVDGIYEDLAWLGIQYDYSFRQSEKTDRYKSMMDFCLKNNLIYPVYDTEEEIENLRRRLQNAKKPVAYKRIHAQTIPQREVYWRFDLGADTITFQDLIKGKVSTSLSTVSDPIICKPNGEFTYTFTSIVDDLHEDISCVIRGVDHLTNTAVQMRMLELMKGSPIKVAHYPLFCARGGQKLSKRTGNFALHDLKNTIHPLALFHYVTFLGSKNKAKFYNFDGLINEFNLNNYASSNLIEFNHDELNRWQSKILSHVSFAEIQAWFPNQLSERQWKLVADSVRTKGDIQTWYRIFNEKIAFANISQLDEKIHARKMLTGKFHGPHLDQLRECIAPEVLEFRKEPHLIHEIKFTNTISRNKEIFQSIKPGNVSIYACGPTVYDLPHIGNLRMCIVFDVLWRFLSEYYPTVKYTRNITDIDDKIIDKATELDINWQKLTQNVTESFHAQMNELNIKTPTNEPKVTENIEEIIKMIQEIIDTGIGYIKHDGVYFNINQYNQLQNYDVFDCLKNHTESKHDDFVLWKFRDQAEVGWHSPWGWGRPGWHVECSAMARKFAGTQFDIHCGGKDLTFPHHTNEIAQSCSANHTKSMANYWLHNNFVNLSSEKISKSLGNTLRREDINAHPMVVRLSLLMAHYRFELNWNDALLKEANSLYSKWHRNLSKFLQQNPGFVIDNGFMLNEFGESLADDLNTCLAIRVLDRICNQVDQYNISDLIKSFAILGIIFDFNYIQNRQILDLIKKRQTYRTAKDFILADRIRDELLHLGIELEETKAATYFYRHC